MRPADTAPAGTTVLEQDNAEVEDNRLVIGSALAQTLYAAWSGQPVTIVKSPPGAGKTTLLTELVEQLHNRTDLTIVVATPTRAGATDVATRMGAILGLAENNVQQVKLDMDKVQPPSKYVATRETRDILADRLVLIRTVASCLASPPVCDILIADEAYQSTFASISSAAEKAEQIVMVGDPGQIGPVVKSGGLMFSGKKVSPDSRAPEAFELIHDCQVINLRTTYRLGAKTVEAIARLYNFDFDSSRPDRWLETEAGERIDEIRAVRMPDTDSYTDTSPVAHAVEQAAAMVGLTLAEQKADGTVERRLLEQQDIALVAAHNAQVTTAIAMLDSKGLAGITAGTADSLQGGQWHGVVALDPLVGHATAGTHQLSPGRLCVMASRHMTAMVWMFEASWADALLDPDIDSHEADLGRIVRTKITAGKVVDVA